MNLINKELNLFLTALMFFTRIPSPKKIEYSTELLNKSQKYFTLIGWIIGGISALVFWISCFVFPISIGIILSMIASIYVTGAFHEDGFTDTCDAFGGGWTKEQKLTIMKDSRIGAFGTIGICLLLLLKFFTLFEIAHVSKLLMIICLINAHTTSRFMSSLLIYTHEYVQDLDKSKSKPIATSKLSFGEILFSFILTLLPFLLFKNWLFLLILPVGFVTKIYLGHYFKKHIGGYTGDCLGAAQQVSEIVFYLSVIIIWKFI